MNLIEPLEARIAPAALLHFRDVDGDLITIATSKGTNAQLTAAITTGIQAGAVPGGVSIDLINLASNVVFDGTDLTVSAVPGPLGGDGLVNVADIQALNLDLGVVKVGGDLAHINAGKGTPASKVKAINVETMSRGSLFNFMCNVGAINIARDFRGADIGMPMNGALLGAFRVGGSFAGVGGVLDVPNGTIGKVVIKGDVAGTVFADSSRIIANDILSVNIGGSLLGGDGNNSGEIFAFHSIGSVTIGGSIRGGAGMNSGLVHSDGKLGNVAVGGSVIGGSAGHAGTIEGATGIGKLRIRGDLRGGSSADAGDVQSSGGGIAGVKIGGSLVGGTASFSGRIVAGGGDIGPVIIGGDLASNGPVSGTLLTDSGIIFAVIGTTSDAAKAKIASITIGGSVVGVGVNSFAQIVSDGTLGPVKIGRDAIGGPGTGSGGIQGISGIASLTIGGNLTGGAGFGSGSVSNTTGHIGPVQIGGSLIGGGGDSGGRILSTGKLGNVTVGGDVIAGAGASTGSIASSATLGAVRIAGSLFGTATNTAIISGGGVSGGSQLAIKSVTIGGRVEHANISSASADAQFGPVRVGGDWIDSNLETGIFRGGDGFFGTSDDSAFGGGNPALFSKIASIVIGGQVAGTPGAGDNFGFVSQRIGSLKIHGVSIPLTPGRGNDTSTTNTHFILGATRDVTVHEVV